MTDEEIQMPVKKADRKKLMKESDKLYEQCRQLLSISKSRKILYMDRIFEISDEINYPKRIEVNGQFKYYRDHFIIFLHLYAASKRMQI